MTYIALGVAIIALIHSIWLENQLLEMRSR
jgi:hypothetical protein